MMYFRSGVRLLLYIATIILFSTNTMHAQLFTKQIIDGDLDWASGVATVDMDGDFDVDVVATGASANEVVWYENDGSQNFTKHTVDSTLGTARSCYGVDLDLDLDIDIIAAASGADMVVWYENDGSHNFTRHTIIDNLGSAWDVFVIDLDLDNDLDVVVTAASANVVNWYENDGSQNFTEHTIDSFLDGAEGIYVIDLEGDNDLDVVAAGIFADAVFWYENDSSQNFNKHDIDTLFNGANDVFVDDMDLDGDLDVVASGSQANQVVWYENDGSQGFTKQIVAGLTGARAVFIAYINGDTLPDIAAVSLQDMVMWYENLGSGNFSAYIIDNALDLAFGLYVADVDSDTDLDVLATGGIDDDLVWYESDLVGINEGGFVKPADPSTSHIYNHPNPFRHTTAIHYELVHPAAVVLRIYDISGQLVQTLVDEAGEAGHKTVQWDGCDARGDRVPAGVYFYILETGFSVDARQMILVE